MPKKYTYNTQVFHNYDAISYYLLGVFMTDGNVDRWEQACSITSTDRDWLKAIGNIICPGKPLYKRNYTECWDLVIHSVEICKWLISNNCTPNKSLTIQLPIIPDQYFFDFLRGVIDGDGCIHIGKQPTHAIVRKFSVFFVSASKHFVSTIHDKLSSFEISSSIHISRATQLPCSQLVQGRAVIMKHDMYRLTINGRAAVKMCELLYVNATTCLERKRNNFKEYLAIREWELQNLPVKNEPLQDPHYIVELLQTQSLKATAKQFGMMPGTMRKKLVALGLYTINAKLATRKKKSPVEYYSAGPSTLHQQKLLDRTCTLNAGDAGSIDNAVIDTNRAGCIRAHIAHQ